ncbi:MAG: ABC transporter substrate-binding protein [Cyanobacteriota bacterium]|nr:ABC transporter substrate-binding protein [Cyanobacteriota bacterium]
MPQGKLKFVLLVVASLILILGASIASQKITDKASSQGITLQTLQLGSVLALKGQEEALGNQMKAGLEAALSGEVVRGKKIKLLFRNDFYEPPIAARETRKLLRKGIFLMVGNVGTPTAEKTLPILSKHNIPAVGFLTGADILRRAGSESTINYRASYAQEIDAVTQMALKAGVKPKEICAYVQQDGYGVAGLKGLRKALAKAEVAAEILRPYDRVLASYTNLVRNQSTLQLNGIGPVGFYIRNTPNAIPGYQSLKQWEEKTETTCKLVVTAGTYSNVARFVKLVRENCKDWAISSLSFTDAEAFKLDLEEYGFTEKIIMTQVVPLLDADLPIVKEAKTKLNDDFGYISLEGYIVGKMTLKILNDIKGKLNRDNFIQQVSSSQLNLGGVTIDFTEDRTQASDLIKVTTLKSQGFVNLSDAGFSEMFQ